jgi:3-hydroxymyristoyl/3-hydroxydecanoyl-(acyl carrier protein) dehydratase
MTAAGSSRAPTEPEVLTVRRRDALVELELSLPPGLLYFAGHFDGFAVLPGVVQLHWAIGLARAYLPVGRCLPAEMQIKFRRPIRPDARLTLRIALAQTAGRKQLTFDYRCGDTPCSSGKITLCDA